MSHNSKKSYCHRKTYMLRSKPRNQQHKNRQKETTKENQENLDSCVNETHEVGDNMYNGDSNMLSSNSLHWSHFGLEREQSKYDTADIPVNTLVESNNDDIVGDFDEPSSQELMPPPGSPDECITLQRSRSRTKSIPDIRKRRSTRSSSRSTLILSDEETEAAEQRRTDYMKRSSSKKLKRSDDWSTSIPSRASSRSTVLLSSSFEST